MKKNLFGFFVLSSAFFLSAMEIHISPEASAPEKNAARELSSSLEKIYGKKFTVTCKKNSSGMIFVGQSPEVAALLGNPDFSRWKADEIIIKKIGGNMVVTGGRPRGTLYAVFELLEQGFGVKYWTPEASFPPRRKTFSLPELDIHYFPAFECREVHNDSIVNHPLFAVKMRNNGHFSKIPGEWGGHIRTLGWCHTFRQLISPKQYFQSHPEYFAEREGKRTADGQPCLTNPGFRRELVRKAAEWLKRNPGVEKLSLSQNDNDMYCQCSRCNDFVKRHGNQTDLLIDTVNEAVAELKKQFPEIMIETLAYLYTRQPPKTVKPHPDLAIRLCNIECNAAQPLNSPANQAFASELRNWRQLTSNLYIWNYITNFSKFYQPHPNWKNLAPDLRLFAQNGARGIFEQSSFKAGGIADLTDLRVWLVSKLLWNPAQDAEKLIHEFLAGYYGSAAPEIGEYINLMNTALERHPDTAFTCYTESTRHWLDDDLLLDAYRAMSNAAKKVYRNPELKKRVAIAAFPTMLAVLDRPHLFTGDGKLGKVNAKELLEKQLLTAKSAGTELFSENRREGTASALEMRLKQQLGITRNDGIKPAFIKSERWFAKAAASGRLHKKGICCFVEKDPASGIENSLRMPANHNQWALQIRGLPSMKCNLYMELRCDGKQPEGAAVTIGIYSLSARKEIFRRQIPAKDIAGEKYKIVEVGEIDAEADCFLYCAPVINRSVDNIWLKRCILAEK